MVDTLTPDQRSERMRRVRSTDTKPEMAVRRALHRLGYRYRLHVPNLPGKPDLVFPSRKKALLVHGCYWHGHTDPNCKLARTPKSRLDFWLPKLAANKERDARQLAAMEALGWRVMVVWECETKNLAQLVGRIIGFLEED